MGKSEFLRRADLLPSKTDKDNTEMESKRQIKKEKKRKHQQDFDEELETLGRIGKAKCAPAPSKAMRIASSDNDSDQDQGTEMDIGEILSDELSTGTLKQKADGLQESLLQHLATVGKNPTHGDLREVVKLAGKMHAVLIDSLLYTSKLEGQIGTLEGLADRQQRTIEAIPKNAVTQPEPAKMTYAERLGLKSKAAAQSSRKQDPPNLVTILPAKQKSNSSSETTKAAIQKLISPTDQKLQVRNVRRIQGNGIIVETATKKGANELLACQEIKAAGFIVGTPAKKSPKVVIFDVPKMTSEEATLNAIAEQNLTDKEKVIFKSQAKLAFKTGSKTREESNWVLETSKEVRDILIQKARLYIGWRCSRVEDYIAATRCYKCQNFGHTTKYCRSTDDTCGHCSGQGHTFKTCPNKAKAPVCVNCKRAGKPHSHDIKDRECPAYKAAINQVLSRTDYGQ